MPAFLSILSPAGCKHGTCLGQLLLIKVGVPQYGYPAFVQAGTNATIPGEFSLIQSRFSSTHDVQVVHGPAALRSSWHAIPQDFPTSMLALYHFCIHDEAKWLEQAIPPCIADEAASSGSHPAGG